MPQPILKPLCTLVLLLAITVGTKAQHPPIAALSVNDQVPPITFQNILYYKDTTSATAAFHGKLLILCFTSIYCRSSLHEVAALTSLQDNFNDSVQVFLVVKSVPDDITGLFQRRKTAATWTAPIITNGAVLKKYFPSKTINQVVWITPQGKVAAITNTAFLTHQNIQSILRTSLE